MNKADLQNMAAQAGFGGNLRNTHAVKLETLAALVLGKAAEEFDSSDPEVAYKLRMMGAEITRRK